MPKNNRAGQAAILNESDYLKIVKQTKYDWQKLLLSILKMTGERIGAVVQLQVLDVYADPAKRVPLEFVTFRAGTRKKDKQGKAETRQVPILETLDLELRRYSPPPKGFLFPSPSVPGQPVTTRACDEFFRVACERAGLGSRGFSLHSFRRSLITNLSNQGVSIPVIKAITGHRSVAALERYIETNPDQIRAALEKLN